MSLITGYAFLPFVMAAGISIFPLTALEGALFAVPGLIAQIMVMQGGSNFGGRSDALGMLWLLVLVAGIAILSGMSQLHFWSEIVNKTSKDPLTGAYNRATGQELMEKYFYLAKRARSPLWILFFDLDNFKSINDKFGHEAGDETLKTLVSSITRSTRNADLLVRWGGEEFLAVIPLSKVENIHTIIRRICRAGSLGQRPDGAPITASVGMSEILTDNTSQLSQLIVLADQRMYRAKKSGKNRVCFGDGEGDITEVGTFG
ncbi:MAG: GGDEF domain-containing protein [Magnetococcales bacterium]|nr:GGDEF domain-containing protein [Magnetococcales bacterium]